MKLQLSVIKTQIIELKKIKKEIIKNGLNQGLGMTATCFSDAMKDISKDCESIAKINQSIKELKAERLAIKRTI